MKFYSEIKMPKVGQTIYMIESLSQDSYLKELFITKVITSRLTKTLINPIKESMKNHIIVETRCGEVIDLSTGERCCEKWSGVQLTGKIFHDKGKAKKYLKRFAKLQTLIPNIMEEAQKLYNEGLVSYPKRRA